ncbi:hypothetical protein NEOLEDRAFT_1157085 [Neolentinus lepideus HHB14362 ss-1]|uniref:Aminoglycoside phosphotransferase domain-containing protein n=1 Tax=Neolentinus lepideus HHB14362 ss-1 TaxID=1314782 RepID=A0A165RLL3_9AGAM|nr:hypothetical protein NEOLEDRAFT_1157085 [Neolentinus lepideus HHB14362 ss-1]
MSLCPCDCASGAQPSVREDGACRLCKRQLCATHDNNTCTPSAIDEDKRTSAGDQAEEHEIRSLLSSFHPEVLKTRASSLRGGIPCSLEGISYDPAYTRTAMGGMNYHINIQFEDGVSWICRLRRQKLGSSSAKLQQRIVLSEAASIKYLSNAGIPVPHVYDYGVGKLALLGQLADIFIKLKENSFDCIGCLTKPDDQSIGPLVAENATDTRDGELDLLGPFSSSTEYRVAFINRQLDLISRREAYIHDAVDAYLVHRSLLDYITTYPQLQSGDQPPFFLRHMDDKGDHILVDDNDWEWVQTTCEVEAFCAPFFLLDIGAYYDGSNELSDGEKFFAKVLEEKGRHDLATHIRNGRVQHRLLQCIAGPIDDTQWFPNLFAGLLATLHGESADEPKKMWREWREAALGKYQNEERLCLLLAASSV